MGNRPEASSLTPEMVATEFARYMDAWNALKQLDIHARFRAIDWLRSAFEREAGDNRDYC